MLWGTINISEFTESINQLNMEQTYLENSISFAGNYSMYNRKKESCFGGVLPLFFIFIFLILSFIC